MLVKGRDWTGVLKMTVVSSRSQQTNDEINGGFSAIRLGKRRKEQQKNGEVKYTCSTLFVSNEQLEMLWIAQINKAPKQQLTRDFCCITIMK